MYEIEEILSGKIVEIEIPESLKPNRIHSLYHNLKTASNPLLTYSIWEREISAIIAHEFFGYNRNSLNESRIPVKFYPSSGWIEDSDSKKKVNDNQMKFIKVQNHFMHTSHHWLLESTRLGNYDISLYINKLIDLGCPPEIADELKQMFPGNDKVTSYKSDNIYVLSQIPHKYKLDEVKKIPRKSKRVSKGDLANGTVRKQQIIETDSIIDKLPTIEGGKLGLVRPDMDLLYPFINRTRLILYFWLEQVEPKLSTQMIESMLFHNPEMIRARKWVFIAWFYEMTQLITKGKQNKIIQKSLLNILSNIFQSSFGIKKYNPDVKYSWSNLNNDASSARRGISRLIRENDSFYPNHPISRLYESRLFRKIV